MSFYKLFISIAFLSFCSCDGIKQNVYRVNNQSYTIVSDSVYSSMPGNMFYQDGLIYWEDARGYEDIIHVVNVQRGKEIASFGDIGQGPEEFLDPEISLSPNGGLFLNDVEKPLEMLCRFSSENGSFQSFVSKYPNDRYATKLLHLDDERMLYLCPKQDKLFHIYSNDTLSVTFGDCPIIDEFNNSYDIFQGKIGYNPHQNLLIYSTIGFPYIAVYRNQGMENWMKVSEIKHNWDYTVSGGDLCFSSSVKHGTWEMALTEDYIVLLQRDVDVEGNMDRDLEGRNMTTVPRSLFLYDYNLNLKKIINMPFRMLRLCGDIETNTVYAMAINPEFELIKIDLE